MTEHLTYLSLGAGVQSTALLLLSQTGRVEHADVAIFADTQSEPGYVYTHLKALQQISDIPILIETYGNLGADYIVGTRNRGRRKGSTSIPFFTRRRSGSIGMLNRGCTGDYKISVIEKAVRELLGFTHRPIKGKARARALIGISVDEADRMKPARADWMENSYPLVDRGINRAECVEVVREAGWPKAEKSACLFCPYRSDAGWRELRNASSEAWEAACTFDKRIRKLRNAGVQEDIYVHRSGRPLHAVDLGTDDTGGWGNECSGICGV